MITSLESSLLGARFLCALHANGYDFDMSQDFEQVQHLAEIAGRGFQMPTFEVSRADLTQGGAAWFFLNKDAQPVGTMAAIFQPIKNEALSSFLKRTYKHQFPNPSGSALSHVSPLLDRIVGDLVYIGELNIHPKHRGNRTVLSCFMRLAMSLCYAEWQPDWVYAFIPDRHMRARLDLVYGFARAYPGALHWSEPEPEKRSSKEWFVGADSEELCAILRQDPE